MSSAAPAPILGIREAAYPACLARLGGEASDTSPASDSVACPAAAGGDTALAPAGAQQVHGRIGPTFATAGGVAQIPANCAGRLPHSAEGRRNYQYVEQKTVEETRMRTSSSSRSSSSLSSTPRGIPRAVAATPTSPPGALERGLEDTIKKHADQKAAEETGPYTPSPACPSTSSRHRAYTAADGGDAVQSPTVEHADGGDTARASTVNYFDSDSDYPARAFQNAAKQLSRSLTVGLSSPAAAERHTGQTAADETGTIFQSPACP